MKLLPLLKVGGKAKSKVSREIYTISKVGYGGWFQIKGRGKSWFHRSQFLIKKRKKNGKRRRN